jgi:hypothetical protein
MWKIRNLLFFGLIGLHSAAFPCPNGLPYQPRSELAGAGFSELGASHELPKGWHLYGFKDASVPLPTELTKRVVLIEEGEWVEGIYLVGDGPRLLWSAHLARNQKSQAIHGEDLLRKAISEEIPKDRPLEKGECVDALTALVFLDQVTNESTTAAYDLGEAIALHGEFASEQLVDVFWRNRNNELVIGSWRLPPKEAAILNHFNAESNTQESDDPFQELLACIEVSPSRTCQDIEVPRASIEVKAGLF